MTCPILRLKAPTLQTCPHSALKSVLLGAAMALGLANAGQAQTADYLAQAEEAARAGDDNAAIQLFQSAIIHSPSIPEPYIGIGDFYFGQDQVALAEKYFGIALEMDPANPSASKALALLALRQDDVAGAEAHLQILMESCAPACPEAAEVGDAIDAHSAEARAGD
jgi:Flp pilus assembly protein TadD